MLKRSFFIILYICIATGFIFFANQARSSVLQNPERYIGKIISVNGVGYGTGFFAELKKQEDEEEIQQDHSYFITNAHVALVLYSQKDTSVVILQHDGDVPVLVDRLFAVSLTDDLVIFKTQKVKHHLKISTRPLVARQPQSLDLYWEARDFFTDTQPVHYQSVSDVAYNNQLYFKADSEHFLNRFLDNIKPPGICRPSGENPHRFTRSGIAHIHANSGYDPSLNNEPLVLLGYPRNHKTANAFTALHQIGDVLQLDQYPFYMFATNSLSSKGVSGGPVVVNQTEEVAAVASMESANFIHAIPSQKIHQLFQRQIGLSCDMFTSKGCLQKAIENLENTPHEPQFIDELYALAMIYDDGFMVSNKIKAFELMKMLAEWGHPVAKIYIAEWYKKIKLYPHYRKWIQKAAFKQNPIAMFSFGTILYQQRQFDLAWDFFHLSASYGHIVAKYYTAVMLYTGLGVEEDFNQAFNLFTEIEDLYPPAKHYAALMEYYGQGTQRNPMAAFSKFRHLANRVSHTDSQYQLCLLYGTEHDGTPYDEEKELLWCKRASSQGSAQANFHLAYMYDMGIGTRKNQEERDKRLQKAASKNFSLAHSKLGLIAYDEGHFEEAWEHFRKAQKTAGDIIAEYYLGMMYNEGQSVKRDIARAAILFTKLAKCENPPREYEDTILWARYRLALMNQRREISTMNEDEITEAMQILADKGFSPSDLQ